MDDETKLTLHGLQQHYVKLKENEKNKKLFELLDVLEFNQVVIFVKSVQRCMALAQLLTEQNFPAIGIHRGMTQEERLSRYQQFKDFQKVIKLKLGNQLRGLMNNLSRIFSVFWLPPISLDVVWILRESISYSTTICLKIRTPIFIVSHVLAVLVQRV